MPATAANIPKNLVDFGAWDRSTLSDEQITCASFDASTVINLFGHLYSPP